MTRESLLTYLNLDQIETHSLEMAAGALPSYFRVRYGLDDIGRMKWSRSNFKYNLYLVSNRVQMECPDGNFAKGPQIRAAFEQKVEESTAEELLEVCQSLAHRLSTDGPEGQTIYYRQMVNTYSAIRRESAKRGEAGRVLNNVMLPHLKSNEGYLTSAVIRNIVSEEDLKALDKAYIHARSISIPDIDDFNIKLLEQDRKRNLMHKDLVSFAEEFMGKNDLQVMFDVLAAEEFEKGHINLDGDNLYYIAGITSIKSGPRSAEFMTSWKDAAVYFGKQIQAAYEYLEKIRRGEHGYGYLRYESSLGKERQEDEDVEFFQTLLEKYTPFLQWEESLNMYFHGDYTFSKRIHIDLKKIKEEHADPAGFTEGILDKIRELVGNRRATFNKS